MISESTASREAALSGRLAFLNTGSGVAGLRIYNGTRPPNANATPSGNEYLLVTVPLSDPAGTVSGGTLTLTQAEPGLINSTGIATWARAVNRDGQTAFDMDVGAVGSGAECELSSTTLYAGGDLNMVSAILG